MKHYLLILVLSLATLPAGAVQKDTLRILAIGNSFSNDAVNTNFGDLAVAAGKHVVVGNLYIGGCSLERHNRSLDQDIPDYIYFKRTDNHPLESTSKVTIKKGIFDEPWDIVTFQQSSPLSGLPDTFEPFLGKLYEYVRTNVPSATRFMWHQTWAYHKFSAHEKMVANYGDQKSMYGAICRTSASFCGKYGLEIIPSGTAVQNLKTTYNGDNCHADGSHLNLLGRYAAACAWFETIFGESVVNNPYDAPYVQPYRCELARNAAHLAVSNPYAVTDMSKLGFILPEVNTDESKVPGYSLPEALRANDGSKVSNRKEWMSYRRKEILDLFASEMYGKAPAAPEKMRFELIRENGAALGGKATVKEVRIHFSKAKNAYMDVLVYTPNAVRKAPMFLGINYFGNFSITRDEWVTNTQFTNKKHGIAENRLRGTDEWPLEKIIEAGYGIATFYRGDAVPDADNSFHRGVIRHMMGKEWKYPSADEWSAVAGWAWCLSRVLDYLVTDSAVDAGKVALFGQGRLGAAALWAGAVDQRFRMVIAHDSGRGGAAISRRRFGQTVETFNKLNPHLFCGNYWKYNGNEDSLPFDQHELLALIAPRPLYISSSSASVDPTGEGIALKEAENVYGLFGKPSTGRHVREGSSAITEADWMEYLKFASRHK